MTLKNKLNRYKNFLTGSDEKTIYTNVDEQNTRLVVDEDYLKDNGEISDLIDINHTEFTSERVIESKVKLDIPFEEDWQAFQTTPFHFDNQYSMIREVKYPIDYLHGAHRFSELLDVIKLWGEKELEHPLTFADQDAKDMVFFDTETTGLGGGVGNTIFLIGYAQVFSDHVVVKQHFLPNPSCEVALYQGFLSDLGDYEAMKLTTYNGKAFDWPQIKTRHTLIRDAVPKLPAFGHFDLLHAARRLWKHNLPSVRLSIVEKEILNIQRESDVPGYLAPLLYFDFLKDKDPKGLQGVFTHNEIDVLSLITLYIHISKKLLNVHSYNTSNEEMYEIARWFEVLGQINRAVFLYEEIAQSSHRLCGQAKFALAGLYKRKKQYEKAAQIWITLLDHQSTVDVEIATELSKLYEHQWKDNEKALYYAKISYNAWKDNKKIIRTVDQQEHAAFIKRIERLERKLRT